MGDYALIRVTPQLLQWADEIVCADKEQFDAITRMTNKPVHCLHIPDEHDFRSPELVSAIEAALKQVPIRGTARANAASSHLRKPTNCKDKERGVNS